MINPDVKPMAMYGRWYTSMAIDTTGSRMVCELNGPSEYSRVRARRDQTAGSGA